MFGSCAGAGGNGRLEWCTLRHNIEFGNAFGAVRDVL
jgi:hypothetical protein